MSASESLQKFIRWVMRDVTYHKHYTATVQLQAGDTVDLLPDDPAIRGNGLSGVPIMYGLPGVKATVAPGTKMTLFFENGDPSKPRAAMWEGGHIELSFANGVMPIGRVGDQVVIPAGIPVSTTGTAAAQTGATTAPAIGQITGGAPTVKA